MVFCCFCFWCLWLCYVVFVLNFNLDVGVFAVGYGFSGCFVCFFMICGLWGWDILVFLWLFLCFVVCCFVNGVLCGLLGFWGVVCVCGVCLGCFCDWCCFC